jgi:hypothetical protein
MTETGQRPQKDLTQKIDGTDNMLPLAVDWQQLFEGGAVGFGIWDFGLGTLDLGLWTWDSPFPLLS